MPKRLIALFLAVLVAITPALSEPIPLPLPSAAVMFEAIQAIPDREPQLLPTYAATRAEYKRLLASAEVRPSVEKAVERAAKTIWANRARYKRVADEIGMPWHMLACIHWRESGGNFSKHLHNGDPLTARTRRVPAGLPRTGNPPFTWEESALDAVGTEPHNFRVVPSWEDERVLYELEKYNGWGYRRPGFPKSPYLWAGTQHYTQGKYTSDRVYNSTVRDQQLGCVPIWLKLKEMERVAVRKLTSGASQFVRKIVAWMKGCGVAAGGLFTVDNFMNFQQFKESTGVNPNVLLGVAATAAVVIIAVKGAEHAFTKEIVEAENVE